MTNHKLSVGSCGRFCSGCQLFGKRCAGCKDENRMNSQKCIIFKCAIKNRVQDCLNCPVTIQACRLMRGLTKSYCIVETLRKIRESESKDRHNN